MASLPSDLQERLDELDTTDRAADALVAGLSDSQLHWQPDGGTRWSIAQCLEHLATANTIYSKPIRAAIDGARARGLARKGPSQSGFLGEWFVRTLEPPARRRLSAPRNTLPGSGLPGDQVVRMYHDMNKIARQLILDAATIDVNRATFQTPFFRFSRVRVATGLRVIVAHNRRHIWQAEQVKKHPAFPR
jgi:DinB family protein